MDPCPPDCLCEACRWVKRLSAMDRRLLKALRIAITEVRTEPGTNDNSGSAATNSPESA